MKLLCLVIFTVLCSVLSAQREADYWYFGNNAGLSFASGEPVALTDGALSTREGCAAISDQSGALLFYTDGQTVWNKNHVPMDNGTGLLGNASATQSGIIVPKPGSTMIYYVFTVPQTIDYDGLKYSTVDMSYNSGLGKVVEKNVPLITPVAEKVTAVRHGNNSDIWVITHGRLNNAFHSYLVDASGVNSVPVTTSIGSVHGPDLSSYVGYMKASPNGNFLACAVQYPNGFFELFDFDKNTGMLSNPVKFENYTYAYGVEFSPDESKLYMGRIKTPRAVYQANLNAGSAASIVSSVVVVGSPLLDVGAIQAGNNGKLYITSDFSPGLDVINSPNSLGVACNYQSGGVSLAGKVGRFGLPSFIQSYFSPRSFNYGGVCFGQTTQFTIVNPTGVDSAHWYFDDLASGLQNSVSSMSAEHVFTSTGVFSVQLTVYSNGIGASSTQDVEINALPVCNLGDDLTLCGQTQYVLDAGAGFAEYEWSTGFSGQTITVYSSGIYQVTVTSGVGCVNSDAIVVVFHPAPGGKQIRHD